MRRKSIVSDDAPLSTDDAARALRHLAARLIHNPTVMARRAGEESQQERYLEALGVVLGIDETALISGGRRDPSRFLAR